MFGLSETVSRVSSSMDVDFDCEDESAIIKSPFRSTNFSFHEAFPKTNNYKREISFKNSNKYFRSESHANRRKSRNVYTPIRIALKCESNTNGSNFNDEKSESPSQSPFSKNFVNKIDPQMIHNLRVENRDLKRTRTKSGFSTPPRNESRDSSPYQSPLNEKRRDDAIGYSTPPLKAASTYFISPISPCTPVTPENVNNSSNLGNSSTNSSKRNMSDIGLDKSLFDSPKPLERSTFSSNSKPARYPNPPSPPKRLFLSRKSSLYESKLLKLINFSAISQISEFEIMKKLGEGSFFEVYQILHFHVLKLRCKLKSNGKIYAIKRAKKPFRGKSDRSRYMREMEAIEKAGKHKHIIEYFNAWQEDLHFYMLLEYCRSNLEEYISSKFTDSVPEYFIWNVAFQIASGLTHVHENGVLHLDIKPANILISENGVLKIGDFGQAVLKKCFKNEDFDTDGIEGDSQYMAPELLKMNTIPSSSADMFSLGCVLFELATGFQLPSHGSFWKELRNGEAKKYLQGKVSQDLFNIIIGLMDPNSENRPSAGNIVNFCLSKGCHTKCIISPKMTPLIEENSFSKDEVMM